MVSIDVTLIVSKALDVAAMAEAMAEALDLTAYLAVAVVDSAIASDVAVAGAEKAN
jgi:hypothetical protein